MLCLVLLDRTDSRTVGNRKAWNLNNTACGYAASRISSNLKGSTKQWLQAPATISKACLKTGLRNE